MKSNRLATGRARQNEELARCIAANRDAIPVWRPNSKSDKILVYSVGGLTNNGASQDLVLPRSE